MSEIKRNLISQQDIFQMRKHHTIRLRNLEEELKLKNPGLSNKTIRELVEWEIQKSILEDIMELEYSWNKDISKRI